METQLLIWNYALVLWILYLFLQGLFINGIKAASAGTTEILPDGSVRDSEMILYPMAKFLMQKESRKIFYSGTQLTDLYSLICQTWPIVSGAKIENFNLTFIDRSQHDQFVQIAPLFRKHPIFSEGVDFKIDDDSITFWKEEYFYKYSGWVRKPIIQCIVCMASFWGLFTFFIPLLIISHFNLWSFPLYVGNTLALAVVNKYIYKKTQ